jgi:DNA-binding IclR family transcriptional regulator
VLGGPSHSAINLLYKLGSRRLALGAEFGSRLSLMNITANAANKLSHLYIHSFSLDNSISIIIIDFFDIITPFYRDCKGFYGKIFPIFPYPDSPAE